MRNDYKMPKYTNLKEEKNLMKNKNNLLKFTNIVLLITMIAIILVAGTYAKYSSSASGTDATVVANWSFEVNGQDITILGDKETITFGLFSTVYDSDGKTAETDVATGADKNLIAPGTSGSFEFKVQNTSDVTTQYAIDFTVTNANNIPIEYSTDGTTWTNQLADIVASNDTILAIGSGEKSITVQWRWGFSGDDSVDTNLATLETAPTITVEASITATQLNNGANAGEVVMLNGDGQTYYTLAPTALSFRSSANIGDFQEVQVNGETIDPSNYTKTEGSTIINLSIDYLKTLAEADYSISIVSKTGSPSAGFSVVEPDVNNHGFYYNQPYTAYVSAFNDKVAFFLRENGSVDLIFVGSEYVETASFTSSESSVVVNTADGTFNGTVSADGKEIYVTELATNFVLGDESIVADEDYIYIYWDPYLGGPGGYEVHCIDKTKDSYKPIKTGIYGRPTVGMNGEMFNGNTNLIVAPQIPSTITCISGFEGCTSLTSIIIPEGVTEISSTTFQNCTSLKNISIPDGVTVIGSSAFNGCTSLTSITIPESVTKISNGAFMGCTNLTNVYLGESKISDINSFLFEDCTNLTSISIPSSVTRIFAESFRNCAGLKNITYNGTVAQWEAITKEVSGSEFWNRDIPATEVVCSDGTVAL